MSFVSCRLFLSRRSISSEMSTADSSWTKRNSSILVSSSAIGCSNSRKCRLLIEEVWARWRAARAGLPAHAPLRPTMGDAHGETRWCGPSIVHGQRVEAAPNVPRGHRAKRRPRLAHFARFGTRNRLAAEIVDADALDQAEVVERQHVGAHQVEDQEHLRGPAPDAADGDQLVDNGLVFHHLPLFHVDATVLEVLGEVDQVLALARRQAGAAQAL